MAAISEVSNGFLEGNFTDPQFQSAGADDEQDEVKFEHKLEDALTSESGHDKPTLVRIKRKRTNEPIDNLWLEVSRPAKRQEILLSSLALNDVEPIGATHVTNQRKLFRYLDTLSSSCLKDATISQILKDKQNKLLATARKEHERGARAARFEQIWSSRRGSEKKQDLMQEYFHLYDIIRVDTESEAVQEISTLEQAEREADNNIIQKYLPLLREYLPSAVAELDIQQPWPSASHTDDYVYDVYTVDPDTIEDKSDDYPTVRVVEDWCYSTTEPGDQDDDSQDSNDENNPINDYPEEEDDSEIDCSEYSLGESNADGSEGDGL